MKYIFIIQSEGRGHLTQAISLYQLLTENGHTISHVIVGKNKHRIIPYFFKKHIHSPITQVESPYFFLDKNNKKVHFFKTLTINLWRFPTFLRSINQIDQIVKEEKPDIILNFYEFIGGLFFMLKKNRVRHIAISHQFLFTHRNFSFPKGRIYDKIALRIGNKFIGYKAHKLLALSFKKMENMMEKKLYVMPPLLRENVKKHPISSKSHLLVYMVYHGYYKEVLEFHQQNPTIPIHCFWNKKDEVKELKVDKTLTFHQLDDELFIEKMANCRGYVTTAGFESICEAMYMDKPIMMIPVEGHYEQACNALDAEKAGAGLSSKVFDLRVLLDYIPKHKNVGNDFRDWSKKRDELFLEILV